MSSKKNTILKKPLTFKSFELNKVEAAKDYETYPQDPNVLLHYTTEVLHSFQFIMENALILGTSFHNPYTHQVEQFPNDAANLTARHLQILARNESKNTTGLFNFKTYHNLLSEDQITTLRALVKQTPISGIVEASHQGGYPSNIPRIPYQQNILLVDQSGFQWQRDFRNTGGLFFYPDNIDKHLNWKNALYPMMFGLNRPVAPSSNTLEVTWGNIYHKQLRGKLDLDLLALGIENEFRLAWDAVCTHRRLTQITDKICFKFLEAGMGDFRKELNLEPKSVFILKLTRLTGILNALKHLHANNLLRNSIECLELPFTAITLSTDRINALQLGEKWTAFNQALNEIELLCQHNGIVWGGAKHEDVLMPRSGYMIATTNCADPHTSIGNEHGFHSVDAMLACNIPNIQALNPGANLRLTELVSDSFYIPQGDIKLKLKLKLELESPPVIKAMLNSSPVISNLLDDSHHLNGSPITPSPLRSILTTIRDEFKALQNERQSWFTYGMTTKLTLLNNIEYWMKTQTDFDTSPQKQLFIQSLLQQVCAIKRNPFGFLSPHSLKRFHELLNIHSLSVSENNHSTMNLKTLITATDPSNAQEEITKLFNSFQLSNLSFVNTGIEKK